MKLSEIHVAIEAGRCPELPEDQAFGTLVAIEHLARIEGLPVSALAFTAPLFGAKYSYHFSDLRGSWSGRSRYLAWRNLILNTQLLFAPADVDADPWKSLDRAERLWKEKGNATLHCLYRLIPEGRHPREVTDVLLEKVHGDIPPEMVPRLRAGINSFRRLFRNDLALRTGLLPDAYPDPLPGFRSHRQHTSMSPKIEAWRNSLSDKKVVYPLDYLNRLAIAGGRLDGKTDTLNDLRAALCKLPQPSEVGVPSIAASTLNGYVSRVRCALGGPDPRKTPAEQAWADLRAAARAAGCETSFLWAVAQPAAARGLTTTEISETTALEILRACDAHHERSAFRRGCEQFDALQRQIPPDHLPLAPLGIKRLPPRSPPIPKPVHPPDPVMTAWTELYARLRERGWTQKQVYVLSYLRIQACATGIAPGNLSEDFIGALESDIIRATDRTRLHNAVRSIATLSKEPDFSDLPYLSMLDDKRFSRGGPDERARAELEELMDFMNAAAPTRRSFRLAVGVLTDAMGRPDIPLKETLQADISAYDFGPHEPRRKVHTDKIRNLRRFVDLPWTPAWRELQRVVTGTGLKALDNPVPKILAWNPRTDPDGLTLEWAQRLDRDFRSTLRHPPHGRTYIAKKLVRHLAAFDALHNIPAVAGSGLMPPRIGQIR